jgi:hypothetical protein
MEAVNSFCLETWTHAYIANRAVCIPAIYTPQQSWHDSGFEKCSHLGFHLQEPLRPSKRPDLLRLWAQVSGDPLYLEWVGDTFSFWWGVTYPVLICDDGLC